MSKYYLSLCCIIKDEMYLEEFIIYYRILGVEHFYIYDNESVFPISVRLDKPYFKDFCTILPIYGKIQQLNAYNDCLHNFKNESVWLIIVDGDEYILPKKENHFSIRDFLNEYEDAHAIGINWMMFGSSFHEKKQGGFLIDDYRYCENKQNCHIKTICKPQFSINFTKDPHHLNIINPSKYLDPKKNVISGPFNHNYTIDIIQINHYSCKSTEEQWEKNRRGYPDQIGGNFIVRDPLSIHNIYNNVIDNYLPDKYLSYVKEIYFKLYDKSF